MTSLPENAVARFRQNFNCAQSVLVVFAPQLGLDESQALKLASTFGGGIARRGQTCGAVTGALLALGLAQGGDTPSGKEDTYRLAQEFMQHFESKHGTSLCRELINSDISTPEGRQQAREKGAFTALCPLFVHDAAEIAQAMLAKKP